MNVFDRRRFLAASVGLGALAAAPALAQASSPEVARLDALLDQFLEEELRASPEIATVLGLDVGARAPLKARLHEGSLAALERDKARTASQLARLSGLDRKAFSGLEAVNYDTVLHDLTVTDAANRRFAFGGQGARQPYVLSQITGAYQDVPEFLAAQHTIETRTDCEAYLARLDSLARLLDQECERVRHDAGLGVVPPDFALTGAIASMKTMLVPAGQSPLVASLVDRARAKGIAGDWGAEAAARFRDKIAPALERQVALLEGLLPKATHDAGVWRLPDGEAYYAAALASQTTTNLTPQEIHQMGLDQTRELSARADVLFRKIGLSEGTVAERYKALFKDKKYLYPNTEEGRAKLIADLSLRLQAMQRRLPQYFGVLPKAGLEIRRIPKETEQAASTHYNAGSIDGTRPGIYWLNLRDTAETPFWGALTTTFHEGVPGHHLQGSLQQESALPTLRKTMGFAGYSEGWALYAEQLAQEMGVYADDPVGELGYIHDALLRSGRLVTDTGLHALRWSREQAAETLSSIDGDPPALALQEIERYSVWPGQACSYMVGKLTILRLRAKAQRFLGPRFDIRKFHDAILLSGAVPLTVLETVVDDHIIRGRLPRA